MDYDVQARRTWDTPFGSEGTAAAQMLELVRYATLAPSGHNAQPWKFAIRKNTIRIYPDFSRRLPVVDPQDRELWISLGCALENLTIAAQQTGYEVQVSYPEPDADDITLHMTRSSAHSPSPLFDAIPHRQNTRSLYDGTAASRADVKRIESVASIAGVTLQTFTDAQLKEAILEYVKAGNRSQYANAGFRDELLYWLRFNTPEALHSSDGLYAPCSGSAQVPRWLGRMFVTSGGAGRQSATDEKSIRSSSGLLVISAAQDDKIHWIETGRLYERLALTLTACGMKVAFLNQPLEVAALRSQFQNYLRLGTAQPLLLLRFGYAAPMPRSLRRPLAQVLV